MMNFVISSATMGLMAAKSVGAVLRPSCCFAAFAMEFENRKTDRYPVR